MNSPLPHGLGFRLCLSLPHFPFPLFRFQWDCIPLYSVSTQPVDLCLPLWFSGLVETVTPPGFRASKCQCRRRAPESVLSSCFITTQSTASKGKNKTLGYKVNVIFKNNLSLSAKYIAAVFYLSPNLNLTLTLLQAGC